MIRVLIICIIFLLLYCGFVVLSQLDSVISFDLYNLYIETTVFTIVTFFILSLLCCFIVLKTIFSILDLPSKLKDFFYSRQITNNNYLLIQAMTEYIIGENSKAMSSMRKITDSLKSENKEFYRLFLAEIQEVPEKRIRLFQELEKSKSYSAFVTKRLAELYYQNSLYTIAEEYAVKSFNLNESDSKTVEILIDCYAKLSSWTKLAFLISKLNRLDLIKYNSIKNKLADYCVLAAKNMIDNDKEEDAIPNVELATKLVPSHYDALTLYFSLRNTKSSKNIEILNAAFIDHPSFEIAQLYKQFSSMPPVEIYENLVKLINPNEHLGLFLSVAAYYDLPDKIAQLKGDPKLLSFHQS